MAAMNNWLIFHLIKLCKVSMARYIYGWGLMNKWIYKFIQYEHAFSQTTLRWELSLNLITNSLILITLCHSTKTLLPDDTWPADLILNREKGRDYVRRPLSNPFTIFQYNKTHTKSDRFALNVCGFLIFTVVDAIKKADDPWAWVDLAADVVSLAVPFATGDGHGC